MNKVVLGAGEVAALRSILQTLNEIADLRDKGHMVTLGDPKWPRRKSQVGPAVELDTLFSDRALQGSINELEDILAGRLVEE